MFERDHQSSAELILHNFNAHGVLLCECGYKAMPMDELADSAYQKISSGW